MTIKGLKGALSVASTQCAGAEDMAHLAMYCSSYVTHGGVCPKVQAQHMSMVARAYMTSPIKLHTCRVIN